MAWTTPKTWQTAELVTAALLNTHVRDNLNILAAPALTVVTYRAGSDYVATSTSFADVDATNLAGSITLTFATRIRFTVALAATYAAVSGTYGAWDILVDGTTRVGNATYGLGQCTTVYGSGNFTTSGIITGLTAGAAHTFKLQFKETNAADTLTLLNTSHYITIIAEEV